MQLLLVLFGILVHVPVTSSVPEGEKPAPRENVVPSKTEYERYLDQILLSFNDEKTREILKNATPEDIKNGLIEKTLRKIHPDIRSKLDEVKRGIIMEYRQKLRRAKMDDKVPEELHKFQDDDLKHLLKERHDRLKAMDSERQKQFKKYEMEKELKHRMALRAMNEYDRKVQEALDSEEKEKKMQKQKDLKHPGNKAQFEAQWEAEGFDKGSFNPKTFFMMHDLNGDGEWDFGELEAIFEKEVEELFEGFEADGEEISEEVARMREHVVEHMDLNDDGFIQIDEFLKFSEGKEWDHNDPWDTVFSFDAFDDSDVNFDDYEKNMDEEEKKELEDAATEERLKREITIKKYEDESKKNMDMLKEHSEQLKKAILEANKFRELEKAKKLVAEMAGGQPDAEQPQQVVEEQHFVNQQQLEQQRLAVVAEQQKQAEQFRLAEEQRQTDLLAEQQRQAEQQHQAEILAEQQRQAQLEAEQQSQMEQQRIHAEQQAQAEQQRQLQLQAEQQAEQQRLLAEQQRILAEQQAEQQAQLAAEQQRQAQLQAEQLAEQQRQQAEQQRQQAVLQEQLNKINLDQQPIQVQQ